MIKCSVYLANRESPYETGYVGEWTLPCIPDANERVQAKCLSWFRVVERVFYADMDSILLYVEPIAERVDR